LPLTRRDELRLICGEAWSCARYYLAVAIGCECHPYGRMCWWRGGATDNERRIEIDLPRRYGLLRFDVPNEHLRREIAHFELRHVNGREGNHEVLAELDVVESHDGNVFRAPNAELRQCLAQTHRNEIVVAGNGGRTVAFCARLKECVAAAVPTFQMGPRVQDVVGAEYEVAAAVRAVHASYALLAMCGVSGSGEVCDSPVSKTEQVFDGLLGSADVLEVDYARGNASHLFQKYEWEVSSLQLEEMGEIGVLVHYRSRDQPIDILVAEELHRAPLGRVAPFAADDEEHIALCFGVGTDSRHNFVVIRIVVLLDYHGNAAISARRLRSGLLGRPVVEQVDCREHPVARIAFDRCVVVEYS